MITLNFPRHFTYLAIAVVVLIFTQSGSTPHWIDRSTFLFGLDGLLHATALVLALNLSGAFAKRLLFIAITAALSANVPFIGGYVVSFLHLHAGIAFVGLYAVCSAFGAAAYWALVRLFWLRGLTKLSFVQAISFCVGATFASLLAFGVVTQQGKNESQIAQALPTIFWWFGVSASLWICLHGVMTANNRFERSQDVASSMNQGGDR